MSSLENEPEELVDQINAPAPVQAADRILVLDVLRGFALLGILTMNITGMGMASSAYFDPLVGRGGLAAGNLDIWVWRGTDIFFEGAMRTLFSMLFGAGIVLFTTGLKAKSGSLHYRRTFWLLLFGVFDVYVLLWTGDILIVYAIGGAILYWLRNLSARWLFAAGATLLILLSLFHFGSYVGMSAGREALELVRQAEASGAEISTDQRELAKMWIDFRDDSIPTQEYLVEEIATRKESYRSVWYWSSAYFTDQLGFVLPIIMMPDAIVMMLLGMALFKCGVLDGTRSRAFYGKLAVAGFVVGLTVNGYEAYRSHSSGYDFLNVFGFMQATYDVGRLGMALGYMGLVVWWCKGDKWIALRTRLSAVGRMALTNYLMHSLIALLLFTGTGFALVGELARWQLYPIMLAIWGFQLWFSPWWLSRHQFGPVEYVWRKLTYGRSRQG